MSDTPGFPDEIDDLAWWQWVLVLAVAALAMTAGWALAAWTSVTVLRWMGVLP